MYRKDLLTNNCGQMGFNKYEAETSGSIAEVFYYVNYVNVNYLVKNSTVDYK